MSPVVRFEVLAKIFRIRFSTFTCALARFNAKDYSSGLLLVTNSCFRPDKKKNVAVKIT